MTIDRKQLERLHEKKILDLDALSDKEVEMLKKLSPEDVEALLRIHAKMGNTDEDTDHLRPMMLL